MTTIIEEYRVGIRRVGHVIELVFESKRTNEHMTFQLSKSQGMTLSDNIYQMVGEMGPKQ